MPMTHKRRRPSFGIRGGEEEEEEEEEEEKEEEERGCMLRFFVSVNLIQRGGEGKKERKEEKE